MANETQTVWTRKESRRTDFMLLARAINKDWLATQVPIKSAFFQGALLDALCDLRDASKADQKKNLPIGSLRLMLQASMEGVINVDRDLGLNPSGSRNAIDMMDFQLPESVLCEQISQIVLSWCINVLEPWAQRNNFGSLSTRVKKGIKAGSIGIFASTKTLKGVRPQDLDFNLISRLIAEQLSSQVLFEGMGACEMVLSPTQGTAELMSPPRKPLNEDGGKNPFSMMARIHISTAPFTDNVFLSMSVSKRVWASKPPNGKNTGTSATAYVIADDGRVIPVGIIKTSTPDGRKWQFTDEYASLVVDSGNTLPLSFDDIFTIGQYAHGSWWVGLPQITRLFHTVDQHTPIESDEVDLLKTVVPMLGGIVNSEELSASRKMVLNKKPKAAMLKLEDVGAAGVSLLDGAQGASEDGGDDDGYNDELDPESGQLNLLVAPQAVAKEKTDITIFRQQCIDVLRAANNAKDSSLWVIGGTPDEQKIIVKTAEVLFGDAVTVRTDLLPVNVHGMKADLPGAALKSKQRFSLRVQAWKESGLPQAIAAHHGPKYVMICAAKEIGKKSEDSVNRRAAIHAICSMANASVHHVLPIESATEARKAKAAQAFIHRCQSAMMDVMLAHSGYVIGAGDFVRGQMGDQAAPKYVYGVQALRAKAQMFTGESPVSMVIYSRLNLQTNVTEVSYGYRDNNGTVRSEWLPLAAGLVWIGCQRSIDSDEEWLRISFQKMTIDVLSEAKEIDPRAFVFIDWGTMPSLWQSLRDTDLTNSPPKIGHVNMATAFPLMSFVRIRYGRGAQISLRSWSKVVYEGFSEGVVRAPTGVTCDDGYAGTLNQLVEIIPTEKHPGRGHFIGAMSPRKVFQIKRGKSCYRFMPRMVPISGGKDDGKQTDKVFSQSLVPPLDKDVSVPAPIDITVIQSPADAHPATIASVAMGLRVGYAHYEEWTMLPAPLFFARKIDDYIIKYPAQEDEGLDVVSDAIEAHSPVDVELEMIDDELLDLQDATSLNIAANYIQEQVGLSEEPDDEDAGALEAKHAVGSAEVVEQPTEEKPSKPSWQFLEEILELFVQDVYLKDADALLADSSFCKSLLRVVRETDVVSLHPPRDQRSRRMYSYMMRGVIKVTVDVPYFVRLKGFFGTYKPEMKHNIQRAFTNMQKFEHVAVGVPRPSQSEFLDWLAAKLRHPQGAYVIDSRTLFSSEFLIPQVGQIVKDVCATHQIKFSPWQSNGELGIDMTEIVKKLIEIKDDESLAWVIFAASQTPAFNFAKSVMSALDKIPGPKSMAAMVYYLQTHAAVTKLIREYDIKNGVKPIHYSIGFPAPILAPTVEVKDTVEAPVEKTLAFSLVAVNAAKDEWPISGWSLSGFNKNQIAQASALVAHAKANKEDEFVKIRNNASALLQTLIPGAENFPESIGTIRQMLQDLEAMDGHARLTQRSIVALKDFERDVHNALARIESIDDEGVVAKYVYKNVDTDCLERARDTLRDIELLVAIALNSSTKMHDFLEVEPAVKQTRSEQVKRALELVTLSDALTDALENVAKTMNSCFFLVPGNPDDTSPPPDGGGSPDEAVGEHKVEVTAPAIEEKATGLATPAPQVVEHAAAPASAVKQKAEVVEPEGGVVPAAKPEAPKAVVAPPTAATKITVEVPKVAPVVTLEPAPAPLAVAVETPIVSPVDVSCHQPVTAITPKTAAPAVLEVAAPSKVEPEAEVAHATEVEQGGMDYDADEDEQAQGGVHGSGITKSYSNLKKLILARSYGLASLYNRAIGQVFDDEAIQEHSIILNSLVSTLDSIDCEFTVDARLPEDFRNRLQSGLLTRAAHSNQMCRNIGVLGAGCVAALFSNPTGEAPSDDTLWTVMGVIRQPLTGLSAVSEFLDLIVSMETKGVILTREKMASSAIGGMVAIKAQLEREKKRAENWRRDHALHTSFNHHGFSRMHDYIYSLRHPIGQCLALIANGDVKSLKVAFDSAQGKFKKTQATIIEAYKAVGEKGRPDGRYCVNANENIEITEKFIHGVLILVNNGAAGGPALPPHELSYLNDLHQKLNAAIEEIQSLHAPTVLDEIYVSGTVAVLKSVLRLFYDTEPSACIPVEKQRLLLQVPMDRSLMPSMFSNEETGEKTICSGEDVMQAIEEVVHDDFQDFKHEVTDEQIDSLLVTAQQTHVKEGRFVPALTIEVLLRSATKLEQPINVYFQKAKADLSQLLQDARQRVTHAMALSALDQKDANRLLRIIEGIHASNSADKSIGSPDSTSIAYPDFPHAKATLQNLVLNDLNAKLRVAKDKLLQDLKLYEEQTGEAHTVDIERIRNMLETENPSAIRTAHDACAILRAGGKLPSNMFDQKDIAPVEYTRFIASLAPLRGRLVLVDALQNALEEPDCDKTHDSIKSMDERQRKEARTFLQDWKELCLARGPEAADKAGAFFSAMGIGTPTFMPEATRRNAVSKFQFPEHAFSAIVNTDCFIPPALGSLSRLVCGYVVPGNQPETEVSALIQDVSGVPTFILSRANLNLPKRAKLSGQSPVILIDDNLICYMAMHPDERAKRMMEIGTLTFHTHPYSAEGTFVPREMFFGRQRELHSLREVKSLAMLYGGRRLGKSSLLAQIEREESNVPGSTAIYIPMDRDYTGEDHVLFAWRKIYGALVQRNVIEDIGRSESDWQKIRDWVEQQLTSEKQQLRSCYLLFDEADNLMAQETELTNDKTGFVRSLQRSAENINKKFLLRYVIAGLHNLARMTTESNSALGKAQVIALEPYSSDDDIMRGVQLVTKPMAALGFFFGAGSEDLPLRILSICNFYPAFIQIYCRKLLDHMYNKRGTRDSFEYVTAADLEVVERDHDLLHELQQKFSWTLDLSKKYKAIGLILADCYYAEIETGKNDGLTVSDIRELCEIAAPEHFRSLSGGAYEGLLDEMRKLNVLEKNGARYRLRNPSIAMLIGDREHIQFMLDVLAKSPPEVARNHGDRRNGLIPLGKPTAGRSPIFPMPVAWTHSQMETIDGSLVVIAGNAQSGLNEVIQSKQEWQIGQNALYCAMNLPSTAVSAQITRLRKPGANVPSHGTVTTHLSKGSQMLLVCTPPSWRAQVIPQYAALANKAATSQIRLALAALPDKLYEVCTALANGTLPMPAAVDKRVDWSLAAVPPWSMDAVRFYLHDNVSVAEDLSACEAIIEASCGFGKEIQNICAGNLTVERAMTLPIEARKSLFLNRAAFYDRIGWPKEKDLSLEKRAQMEQFLLHVHDEKRDSPYVAEYLEEFGLSRTDMMFLFWMGLMQEGSDNKWQVPKLYRELVQY